MHPGGVAVDGAGNVYISDLDRNIVVEVPVNGGAATVINPMVNGIGLHYPCGMVIDGAGRPVHRGRGQRARGGSSGGRRRSHRH